MGKLIVFEGTDGSGKSTQFDLLIQWLAEQKKDFRRLRFPRYDQPSSMLVRMYLGGEFGKDPDAISPYAASTFYAVDRYASYIQDWKEYYDQGGILLSDRYTTSNAVHQGGKFNHEQLPTFLHWLYTLEYEQMGLPKPDLVILLDMPTELAQQLLQNRVDGGGMKKDIHELDADYLYRCRETALSVADLSNWTIVHGAEDGKLRSVGDIAQEVQEIVSKYI